jgi:hypothetical protein
MKLIDPAEYLPPVPGKWVKRLAQAGLATKGVVYCLLGALALLAALELNVSSRDVDRKGVFRLIEELVIGRALLGLVAVGLACYCAWRLLQAAKDTEGKGMGAKGVVYRLRYAASGGFYGLLALVAAKLAIGNGGDLRQEISGAVLQNPLGRWLVVMAAAVIALAGAYQVYQGISGRYRKKIKEKGLKQKAERVMIQAGIVGYVARGTVWAIVSYLLVRASLDGSPGGVGNPFRLLERSSHGSFLLGGVAIGLVCYSLFVFMEARFRGSGR